MVSMRISKRRFIVIAAVLVLVALVLSIIVTQTSLFAPAQAVADQNSQAGSATQEDPAPVVADVLVLTTDRVNIRSGPSTDDILNYTVDANTVLKVLSNQGEAWVHIMSEDGRTGWVSGDYVKVSTTSTFKLAFENETIPDFSQSPTVELAAAKQPLTIYVSLQAQMVYVVDANQAVVKKFQCSSGMVGYETPVGNFTIYSRGDSFFNQALGEGAKTWVGFHDDYLFHSMPIDAQGNTIQDQVSLLGQPASHGCIRLLDENALWLFTNIQDGVSVVIRQ